MTCDFCGQATENIYAHVHLCPHCGLVQSEPRSDRTISTSCEADQGNLRNGKAFRFPQSLPILESIDWSQIKTALDIGSNRGSFVRWLYYNHPEVELAAVEPEIRLIDYDGVAPRMANVFPCRFEDVRPAADDSVDFVFSSHTLEHAQSAHAMMQATERLMPIGSQMLLEVPNLATIQDPRVVEQFFIFKHNWHFSTTLLIPYLLDLGFEIELDRTTMFDIRLLLRKIRPAIPYRAFSFAVESTRKWIADYAESMQRNRAALPKVASLIFDLVRDNTVAIWGAGRIFDALVRYGHLDTHGFNLVDGMLWNVVTEVHGVAVQKPECLAYLNPDVIIVLGRTSSDALVQEARMYSPQVLTFNDLLDEALAS